MSPSQEGLYAKISAIAALVALVLGYLAWQHPKQPRPNEGEPPQAMEMEPGTDYGGLASGGLDVTPLPPPALPSSDHSGTGSESNTTSGGSSTNPRGGGKGEQDGSGGWTGSRKSTPECGASEIATLRPGTPARVASGLAVLSVRTSSEGSEAYLTLGIASDRGALAEAVLGAPARFHFKTSLGSYFVNVAEVDLAVGAMTVQVGCEAEGNTP